MILPPNATFDLYRNLTTDEYGDTEDDDATPLYTGLRGVLSYRARTVRDPATKTPQQAETYFCLLPQGTDVRNDDRLKHTETGQMFNVAGATELPTYGFSKDLNVTLAKVAG